MTTTKTKPVTIASIPEALTKLPRWGCWRYEDQGKAKPGKPPFNIKTGSYASPTDPSTWSTFKDAVKAYKADEYEGLSFFMAEEDGLVGVDLDECRNPNNKRIAPWAEEIIYALNSYTEVSPSGRGVRIFLCGVNASLVKKGRHKGKIEAYAVKKALTVTGNRLMGKKDHPLPATVEDRQDELEAFLEEHFPQEEGEDEDQPTGTVLAGWKPKLDRGPDSQALRGLFRHFKKAKALYEGEGGDKSSNEQALANYAAGCGWTASAIADLLVQARVNAGEDAKHRGYYEATIKKALASDLAKGAKAKTKVRPKPIRLVKPVTSLVASRTLEDAKATFKKWLYLEDDSVIDLIVGLVAGNRLPTDPVWLYLVAPPSSGKTELLNAIFGLEDTYFLSDLTPAALISGYVDPDTGEDKSLLPQLDGKLVVIKDFTVILSKPAETRNQLYSILRDAYDGYSCRGMGTGSKGFHSRFNMIAGVTPDIEADWSKTLSLGERFLTFRLAVNNRDEHTRRSLTNANYEPRMRDELKEAVQGVLAGLPNLVPSADGLFTKTLRLADLLTTSRTFLARDRNGCVTTPPTPELAGRVAKQLLRIGQSLALVRGKPEVTEEEFTIMKKVAFDSLPTYRRNVLEALMGTKMARSSKHFADKIRGSEKTIRIHLEDLHLLGIADKQSIGSTKVGYRLTDQTRANLEVIGL